MQLLDRLKTGLVLTKDAILVLRHHPRLVIFPVVSAITGLAFLALFLGVTFGLMAIDPQGAMLVGLGAAYLVLTFVSSFFAAGLVHQTREALADNEPSLKAGMNAAWEVKGQLFVWALISATIGVLINALENSDSRLARLFGTIFGVAWTLMTFFIIPVIVFERTSITGMFKESAGTFKELWGETPVSLIAVQVIGFLVVLPFVVIGYALYPIDPIFTIGAVLTGVLLSFLIGQTLQGVIKTTLYLYATEGKRAEEFDDVDLDALTSDRSAEKKSASPPKTGGFH
ncbi:DUF6159 family protein [Halovivax gelatinilyticus]|uniref:DUF6159 family protein n=1 Tax=Halovivax gelatinilyticus TaxID=2961597 RepID=UPI0020CA63F2|nr:DUF6159 family protein [Halovivax gelatinilyticus]